MKQRKVIPKRKKTFTQRSIELTSQSEEVIESIPNEVYQKLAFFQKQGYEKTIYDFIQPKNDFNIEQVDNLKKLNKKLEKYILKSCEQDLIVNQKIISFIKQVFDNKINEEQFNYSLQNWKGNPLSPLEIVRISEGFNLYRLIQMLETKIIIAKTIQSYRETQQFAFYNKLFRIIINQEKVIVGKEEQLFENLELIAINFINNQENNSPLKKFMNGQKFYLQDLLKHKQIIEFLIARHFDKWLSKISEDSFKSDRTIFTAMRDQSKIKNINFIDDKYSGSLDCVKEIYISKESQKIRLIKMVQASAFLNNFEQEGGNAMTVLSSLESIIKNQNFTSINLKNSTMNNIQFFETNFNNSNINNVSIVSAQFIECQIQNVSWKNLESSCLNILKGQILAIFSKNNSILITAIKGIDTNIYNLSFYSLLTGKQIKTLYKQSYFTNHQSQLKLSCLGQVIVFNDIGISIFWSIQAQKKIRQNYDGESWRKFSNGCQILVQESFDGNINLWKIYNTSQNLKIQAKNIVEVKFSKNNQILIICCDSYRMSCWNVGNGQKITTIQIVNIQDRFSPDGQHYLNKCYGELSLRRIDSEDWIYKIQRDENNSIYKIKFSPDGKIFAIQDEKSISLWTTYNQKMLQSFNYEFEVHEIYQRRERSISLFKFSPDGKILAFKYESKVILWNFNQGNQFQIIEGGFNQIQKIIFSPNQQHLILQNQNSLRLWNYKNYQKYMNLSFKSFPQILDYVFFNSTNESQIGFVYGYKDNKSKVITIKIFNDMKVINEVNFNKEIGITSFALSPDFQKVAIFCGNSIYIQTMKDQKKNNQQKFELNKGSRYDIIEGEFQGMKFSPNSEYLAINSEINYDGKARMYISIQIWRISDSKIVFEQEESFKSPSDFQGYELSYDGQYFAILLNSITVYDIQKQKKFRNLCEYSQGTFAFSLDGQFLASQNQKVIQLWQIDQELIIQNLQGHTDNITKIIFLNDDWIIVSASLDGSIRIWDWRYGQQIQILQQNYFGIIGLSISSYQQRMVSLDQDGTVVFWSNSEMEKLKTSNSNKTTKYIITQKQYHYTPYQIQGNKKFIAYNCNIKGSKIFSTEGYNLCNIFKVN